MVSLFPLVVWGAGIRALIYRDSFFAFMQPFVSAWLGEPTYVHGRLKRTAAVEWIAELKPDVVIEEWVDRSLPR